MNKIVLAPMAVGVLAVGMFVATPASASAYADGVGLFQNYNYGGCEYSGGIANIAHLGSVHFNVGDASCRKLFVGDRVSSFVNNTSCTVRLYTDADYKGHVDTYRPRGQTYQVTYDNAVSSMKFSC